MPKDWETGMILSLFKKAIIKTAVITETTLSSTDLKIYERILERKLKLITERMLMEL